MKYLDNLNGLNEDGYIHIPNFFSSSRLQRLEDSLSHLIKYFFKSNAGSHESSLDMCKMIDFLDKNGKLGEIYDYISYSDIFLGIYTNEISNAIRSINGLNRNSPLYLWSHRILMQKPFDESRTYDWHQETFYTIPKNTNYMQCWFPLFEESNPENGSIFVLPKSHNENFPLMKKIVSKNRVLQYKIDESIVEKYRPKQLTVSRGDLVIFKGRLIHKSGQNNSNTCRFSCVGMFHDLTNESGGNVPKPNFVYRGITPDQWFNSVYNE